MEPAESFLFRMHQVLMSPDCRPFTRHHDAVCRQFAAVHLILKGSRKMRNGFTELNLSVKNAALFGLIYELVSGKVLLEGRTCIAVGVTFRLFHFMKWICG